MDLTQIASAEDSIVTFVNNNPTQTGQEDFWVLSATITNARVDCDTNIAVTDLTGYVLVSRPSASPIPSVAPSVSTVPSVHPSVAPSVAPSVYPSVAPSDAPIVRPRPGNATQQVQTTDENSVPSNAPSESFGFIWWY